MKLSLIISALIVCVGTTQAQETVPREESLKVAFAAWFSLEKIENAPFTVDADIKVPAVLKAGERGALFIPETKLADSLKKTGREVAPLGYLWLKGLSPVVDGKAVASNRVRTSTIKIGEHETRLPLYMIGVRKNSQDGLELLIYGRNREPLRAMPLKKISTKQELPIELAVEKNDDETGALILNIVGEYQAQLTVARSVTE